MEPTSEEIERLDGLVKLRDVGRQELQHRQLTGRYYNPDFMDVETAQLEIEVQWYVNKIDEILEPYEKEN